MIRASHYTLIANIVQQACAAMILLYLPNILGKEDYAQTVYVTVLLSFIAFADMGLSIVYGRAVPALLTQEEHDQVALWNRSTLGFGLLTSILYSVIIALLYYARYENALRAILLLPMPLFIFYFSFHVARVNAGGNFKLYLRVNSVRAGGSLLVFPLVFIYGLTGWFASQLLATLLALVSLGRQLFQRLQAPHWPLVRAHLVEGIFLSCTSALWIQLLNFARLYSTTRYAVQHVATYGIMVSAYQSLSVLIISMFLPVSVGLVSRHGKSEEEALVFANTTISSILPYLMAGYVLCIFLLPTVLGICFPHYHFESGLLGVLMSGIVFYPFFMSYGSLLMAYRRSGLFLSLVIGNMLLSCIFAVAIDCYFPQCGAAWGQLLGLISYTLLMFSAVYNISGPGAKQLLMQQIKMLMNVAVLIIAVVMPYILGWAKF